MGETGKGEAPLLREMIFRTSQSVFSGQAVDGIMTEDSLGKEAAPEGVRTVWDSLSKASLAIPEAG